MKKLKGVYSQVTIILILLTAGCINEAELGKDKVSPPLSNKSHSFEIGFEKEIPLPEVAIVNNTYPLYFFINSMDDTTTEYKYIVNADNMLVEDSTISVNANESKTIKIKFTPQKSTRIIMNTTRKWRDEFKVPGDRPFLGNLNSVNATEIMGNGVVILTSDGRDYNKVIGFPIEFLDAKVFLNVSDSHEGPYSIVRYNYSNDGSDYSETTDNVTWHYLGNFLVIEHNLKSYESKLSEKEFRITVTSPYGNEKEINFKYKVEDG